MINEDSLDMSNLEENLFFENNEFEEVSVLNVCATENCNFIHLKNGTVLSWSDSFDLLGRKCDKTGEDRLNLLPIKLDEKLKVLNISCGKKHCIAKTSNMQVFTWGNNLLGQLGLGKLFKNPEDRKKYKLLKHKELNVIENNNLYNFDDKKEYNHDYYNKNYKQFIEEVEIPTILPFFKGMKIKDILANGNNCFVTTEDTNNVYVWGCNKFNKFELPNNYKRIIFKPYLLHEGCNSNNEIYLDMDYLKNSFQLWEVSIPNNEVSKSLLYMENKLLDNKISEVKTEYKFIKEFSDFTAYRLKYDKYDLIDRIKKLKYFLIQKYKEEQKNLFSELLEEYDKLFEYFVNKLRYIKDTYNEKVFTFDLDKEKYKIEDYVDKVFKKNFDKQSKNLKTIFEKADINSMNNVKILEAVDILFKKVNIYEKLFEEKINFDDIEKDLVQKSQEMLSKIEAFHQNDQENKYFYHTFIDKVIFFIEELFFIGPPEKVVKDLRIINNKLDDINKKINDCQLMNSINLNKDSNRANQIIKNIINELDWLEDHINNTIFDKNNELGIISKKILRENIIYTRQNNLLMNKILGMSNRFYEITAHASLEEFVDKKDMI